MEIRLNIICLFCLGLAWSALVVDTPEPVLASGPDGFSHRLAGLEDAFARSPEDVRLAARLADTYLKVGQPELAVVVLRSAPPSTLRVPAVSRRLAQAYERSGRLLDAYATSDLALKRCARVLGSVHLQTPAPSYDCSELTHTSLERQRDALRAMLHWGVVDPSTDPRRRQAYDSARRKGRMAISEEAAAAEPRAH